MTRESQSASTSWILLAMYMAATTWVYTWVIHHPWRAPWIVPETSWDTIFTQQPSWAYIYITYALVLPVLLFFFRKYQGLDHIMGAAILAQCLQLGIDFLLPSRITQVVPAPQGTLLALIQSLDTPLAAFPSGHVSLPISIAFAAFRQSRLQHQWNKIGLLFFGWAFALAISALYTKQHGGYDVIGGFIFGAGVGWFYSPLKKNLFAWTLRWRNNVPFRSALGFDRRSFLGLVSEAVLSGLALTGAVLAEPLWLKLFFILILATRQHASLVLYHDAVHGLLARNRRLNDFLINSFVGIPMFLPIHMYRALHLQHHQALGTKADPERVLLYHGQFWRYRPLPALKLSLQFLGDLLFWNNLIMVGRYFQLREKSEIWQLPQARVSMDWIWLGLVFWGIVIGAMVIGPGWVREATAIWLLTYMTATQALQKIRSFSEHAQGANADPLTNGQSNNWQPGIIGKLTIWPYQIHFHLEHHTHPHLPWHRLAAGVSAENSLPGFHLLRYLWRNA